MSTRRPELFWRAIVETPLPASVIPAFSVAVRLGSPFETLPVELRIAVDLMQESYGRSTALEGRRPGDDVADGVDAVQGAEGGSGERSQATLGEKAEGPSASAPQL